MASSNTFRSSDQVHGRQQPGNTNGSQEPDQATLPKSRDVQLGQPTSAITVANAETDELVTRNGIGDDPSSSPTSSATTRDAEKENYVSAFEVRNQSDTEPKTHKVKVPDRAWKNTLLRIVPLTGIFALLLAVLSIVVALGILIGSRGEVKSSWSVPPSSWIAVCTAVGNQAVRFAAFQGVAIAWWLRASRGSTVARLHSDWYSGTHVLGAFAAGRKMGLIGLACILSTLVAIDGPFMQRATTIVAAGLVDDPIPLNVTIAPEIARNFTGGWVIINGTASRSGLMFNSTIPSSHGSVPSNVRWATSAWYISKVSQPYSLQAPLPAFISGCPGELCKAKVRGPALASTSCTSRYIPLNFSTNLSNPTSYRALANANYAPPINQISFLVFPSLVLGERESINLVTAYAEFLPDCSGILNMTSCNLVSAIGEYDVSVRDNTVTLDKPINPRILAIANNTQVVRQWDPNWKWYPSTLAGIVYIAGVKWTSYAVAYSGGSRVTNAQITDQFVKYIISGGCSSYSDPREQVLESMNELMFYQGALTPIIDPSLTTQEWYDSVLDPGQKVNTTTTGHVKGTHEVFDTDLFYFLAAALIEGICIALILPTYVGFWKLGRHVTFSPLEIAKAFEAPLLANCNSNSTARDMAKAIGEKDLQYGVVRKDQSGARLAFADPAVIERPQEGARLDS